MNGQFYLVVIAIAFGTVHADGLSVNTIYDPYVQPLERELEWRMVYANDHTSSDHRRSVLGYGQSVAPGWFVEGYLQFNQPVQGDWQLDGYELEVKWQIGEQGQYPIDSALLLELEHGADDDEADIELSYLGAIDWQRSTLLLNAGFGREIRDDNEDEWERQLSLSWRYRWRPEWEPGLELFASEDTRAMGVNSRGQWRLSPGKNLFWQAALLSGVNDRTPDWIARLQIEYEF